MPPFHKGLSDFSVGRSKELICKPPLLLKGGWGDFERDIALTFVAVSPYGAPPFWVGSWTKALPASGGMLYSTLRLSFTSIGAARFDFSRSLSGLGKKSWHTSCTRYLPEFGILWLRIQVCCFY